MQSQFTSEDRIAPGLFTYVPSLLSFSFKTQNIRHLNEIHVNMLDIAKIKPISLQISKMGFVWKI